MNSIINTLNKSGLNLLKKKKIIVKDEFWYNDPLILINKNRLDEFFPTYDMTLEEQLNAFTRLLLYISVSLFLFRKNINYIYIFIFGLVFTFLIYKYSGDNPFKTNIENFYPNYRKNVKYIKPTIDNPFMNVQHNDYIKNPNREAISKLNNYNNKEINNLIDQKFNFNLYKDVSDIFGKNNSQRQFYTMPVTTIPNKQTKFANWLYNNPENCKINNNACYKNTYNNLKASSKFRNSLV
tara:strand:+ start:182 stop:895 length:714 start_codon:yes stop_codon:yes gene_type:complete